MPDRAVALGLAALLLAACATGPKLEPPRVSIAGLQLASADVWAQHFRVRLRLHNPNDRDLPVKGLEYAIEVAGQEFGSGSSAQSFVVPAHGDAELDTNVTTNLAASVLKLVTHLPRTLVPYRLAGKVSLGEGLGRLAFDDHASFTP